MSIYKQLTYRYITPNMIDKGYLCVYVCVCVYIYIYEIRT